MQAAFLSLAHEYLHSVQLRLGMPKECLNFIKALYDCNKCLIFARVGFFMVSKWTLVFVRAAHFLRCFLQSWRTCC